jgi:hypothetical protein
MWAIAAAIFFGVDYIIHGSGVVIGNHWIDTTGLMLAGLFCVAVHLAPRWR